MSIIVDELRLVFGLETAKTTYAFGIDDRGLLRHLYWGPKVSGLSDSCFT